MPRLRFSKTPPTPSGTRSKVEPFIPLVFAPTLAFPKFPGKLRAMKPRPALVLLICAFLAIATFQLEAADKLKALLIDGQNNHAWQQTSPLLKSILESSGRFTVDVSTAPGGKSTDDAWKAWNPKFSDYAVVVSNYNGELWPDSVRLAFVEYVRGGGGFVAVHAADNSFPEWKEYNEMIGLGGWGGRNEKSGPYVRFKDGKFTRDMTPGSGGNHGRQHEFVVETRQPEHPIVKGLPLKWKHTQDELYSKLRGPAQDLEVLATAFDAPETGGTGENEPILMVVPYGKGRVFHTTMGHGVEALGGLGFQVTLQRGTEWAATGKVTLPAPTAADLPADKAAKK